MYTLHIEHSITDFAVWKAAYDADPLGREASGVTAARVSRPVGDDRTVIVELDFATKPEAESFQERLKSQVWTTRDLSPALAGATKTRIVELAFSR